MLVLHAISEADRVANASLVASRGFLCQPISSEDSWIAVRVPNDPGSQVI